MGKLPPFPKPETEPGKKRTPWETIVVTTPVILTVIATILAGLSSSEMGSAQYFRSVAAQMQSKVSDQWGYFQAKKLRAEQCGNTVEILRGISQSTSAATDDLGSHAAGDIPHVPEQPVGTEPILDAIRALGSSAPEADLERQAGKIPQADLDNAITIANENLALFETALDETIAHNSTIEQSYTSLSHKAAALDSSTTVPTSPVRELNSRLTTAISIARLNFNSNRYQREAHYNQILAQLYEIQVRRQSFVSDRYRRRSAEFFYGMLGAQAGVTIATFSLAVQRRNLLWGLAASAGFAAITFAAYVYMFV